MSITAVPISILRALAPTAASSGTCDASLLREVMNAKVGTVHYQAFGLDGEVNGLQKHISCGPRL